MYWACIWTSVKENTLTAYSICGQCWWSDNPTYMQLTMQSSWKPPTCISWRSRAKNHADEVTLPKTKWFNAIHCSVSDFEGNWETFFFKDSLNSWRGMFYIQSTIQLQTTCHTKVVKNFLKNMSMTLWKHVRG